jgi:glycopeptide antibiotics resistance protein
MVDYKGFMRWTLWLISIVVIIALTTMPWSNYVGHSHWDHVTWLPFSDHPLPEVLGNVALFFPFGYFFPQALHGQYLKRSWSLPLITAAMLSTGAEFYQVYTHARFPSTTDICANLLGAILGVLIQRWWTEKNSTSPSFSS